MHPVIRKSIATESDIRHTGFVKKVTNSSLTVTILSQSACSGCHAEGACNVSDMQNKEVEIYKFNKNYVPGQQVTVLFRESKGFTALFFGYVLPFLLVLLTLVISVEITQDELFSGLLALAILIPYYTIIYFFRHQFKKVFNFEVEENN